MAIYNKITDLIGGTPLLRLSNYIAANNLEADIAAKLEYFNPAGSVKDRIALAMLDDAEAKGLIGQGAVIIEPTSGNTGIGLAAVSASRGYRVILTMPETMSVERRNLLKAYGAEIVLTEGAKGMKGAIAKANELAAEIPNSFIPGQFSNPANPAAHIATTGPEIWNDTEGKVDAFVACVGTGGTLSGVGNYLKSKNPNVKIFGVQPTEDSFQSPERPDQEEITGVHPFENTKEEYIPANLDRKVYDGYFEIHTNQAYEAARLLAKKDGVLVGASSGAALYAATQLAQRPEYKGKTIVALLADTGLRYLSTHLFEY
jgi:cysteine synthase A